MEESNSGLNSRRKRCQDRLLVSAVLLLTVTQHFTAAFVPTTQRLSSRTVFSEEFGFPRRETQLYQSERHREKQRQRRESFWFPSEDKSSRLQVRRRVGFAIRNVKKRTYNRLAHSSDSNVKTSPDETWSQAGEKSNRLGVRKRVKAVLKKARSRTGVSNASEDSAGLWIAETASIGGLSEQSDLIIKKSNDLRSRNGVNGVSSAKAPVNGSFPSVMDYDVERESNSDNSSGGKKTPDLDWMKTDVPTPPPEPLPFKLPQLSEEQKLLLLSGERIQEQSKMGREGSGFVVLDVKAPPYVVWECLLDFEAYPDLIKTVRSMEMFTSNKLKSGYHAEKPLPKGSTRELRHYGIPSVTRAAFVLSKFRLNIAAIHTYRPHPDGHYMVFTLDPECTNVVLQSATGIWYTETNPDGRGEEYTRVWLLCELKVSPILPTFIVDYTAKRAMPRATNWLKPHVEPIAEQWAKDHAQD